MTSFCYLGINGIGVYAFIDQIPIWSMTMTNATAGQMALTRELTPNTQRKVQTRTSASP
jgi:hypothetical protein